MGQLYGAEPIARRATTLDKLTLQQAIRDSGTNTYTK